MTKHLYDIKAILLATLLLVLCTFFSATTVMAAPSIVVKASTDSAVVVMGDLNHLRVTVDIPAAYASAAQLVDFPVLTPGDEYLSYKGVDVVASDSLSTINKTGERHLDFDFTVQAFEPGTVTIPPFAVVGVPGADTAFSNVVTFKVLPVDVDSLETINPMESIVSPNTKWYDYIPNWTLWVLLTLLAIACVVAAYFILFKREKIFEQQHEPVIPPYELAVSRLNTLRSRKLAENGHEKEYYTQLVDILREYLQGRFGIYAMEMTSTQIVRALRSNPDTRMTADEMRAVLSIADFVKFAKVRPLPEDNQKAFARAQSFVEQTKPVPEPADDGNAADATIVKPSNIQK